MPLLIATALQLTFGRKAVGAHHGEAMVVLDLGEAYGNRSPTKRETAGGLGVRV